MSVLVKKIFSDEMFLSLKAFKKKKKSNQAFSDEIFPQDTGNIHWASTTYKGNVQQSNWLSRMQKGFSMVGLYQGK